MVHMCSGDLGDSVQPRREVDRLEQQVGQHQPVERRDWREGPDVGAQRQVHHVCRVCTLHPRVCERTISSPTSDSLLRVCYARSHSLQSPNGKYVACGAVDGLVTVFEVRDGKRLHSIEGSSADQSITLCRRGFDVRVRLTTLNRYRPRYDSAFVDLLHRLEPTTDHVGRHAHQHLRRVRTRRDL